MPQIVRPFALGCLKSLHPSTAGLALPYYVPCSVLAKVGPDPCLASGGGVPLCAIQLLLRCSSPRKGAQSLPRVRQQYPRIDMKLLIKCANRLEPFSSINEPSAVQPLSPVGLVSQLPASSVVLDSAKVKRLILLAEHDR